VGPILPRSCGQHISPKEIRQTATLRTPDQQHEVLYPAAAGPTTLAVRSDLELGRTGPEIQLHGPADLHSAHSAQRPRFGLHCRTLRAGWSAKIDSKKLATPGPLWNSTPSRVVERRKRRLVVDDTSPCAPAEPTEPPTGDGSARKAMATWRHRRRHGPQHAAWRPQSRSAAFVAAGKGNCSRAAFTGKSKLTRVERFHWLGESP